MGTHLLMRGAWQGAWVWNEVISQLTANGISAKAFDLPDSGRDQVPSSEVTLTSLQISADGPVRNARRMDRRIQGITQELSRWHAGPSHPFADATSNGAPCRCARRLPAGSRHAPCISQPAQLGELLLQAATQP